MYSGLFSVFSCKQGRELRTYGDNWKHDNSCLILFKSTLMHITQIIQRIFDVLKNASFLAPHLPGWRSSSCVWTATTACQNPRRHARRYACCRLQITSCRTGQKWGSLGCCTPVWAHWCWPITAWTLWETPRRHWSTSSPTCVASTSTIQVRVLKVF